MNQTVHQNTSIPSSSQTRDPEWTDVSPITYLKIAIVASLFYSFFYYEITSIASQWIHNPSWSHGFLIPLFSLYFLNQRKEQVISLKPKPSYLLGLGSLIFLLVLYVLNVVQFKIGYGKSLIMIAALASVVLFLGGRRLFRHTWLPVFYLFFAIPLPDRLYSQITIPMRQWAAQASAIILNLVPDLQATCRGVIIDVIYKGKALEPGLDVAEACSGMRLLMAFVALGVAMAYLHERPLWNRAVLLLSTVPIAILCNIIRVTVTGFIYVLWDPQYAQGIWHDLLGISMLPLAFMMYGGMAWVMSNLYVDEEEQAEEVIIRRKDLKEAADE